MSSDNVIQDLWNSFRLALYDRAASPLGGTFLVSWFIFNHRMVFVLLSDSEFSDKFKYIEGTLYPNAWDKIGHFFAWPAISTVLFIVIYPFLSRKAFVYYRKQMNVLKEMKISIDESTPIDEDERRELFAKMSEAQVRFAKLTDESNKRISELQEHTRYLTEENGKLSSARSDLELELREKNEKLEKLQPGADLWKDISDDSVLYFLLSNYFILHFNPSGDKKKKRITFEPNGYVGEGKNSNEWSWRVSEGQLEILQKTGDLHSRFRFDEKDRRFFSIDEDTPAIDGQVIYLASEEEEEAP